MKPILPEMRAIAEARSGGNKALADEMISDASLKVFTAVKKMLDENKPIEKPLLFARRVAINEMFDTQRRERVDQKFFNFKPIEEFTGIESREKNHLSNKPTLNEIALMTKRLLKKMKIQPEIEEMFIFHTGLKDGIQKTNNQTAKKFNINSSLVANRMSRLRKKMQEALEK